MVKLKILSLANSHFLTLPTLEIKSNKNEKNFEKKFGWQSSKSGGWPTSLFFTFPTFKIKSNKRQKYFFQKKLTGKVQKMKVGQSQFFLTLPTFEIKSNKRQKYFFKKIGW